jgi:hypothetical protein
MLQVLAQRVAGGKLAQFRVVVHGVFPRGVIWPDWRVIVHMPNLWSHGVCLRGFPIRQ